MINTQLSSGTITDGTSSTVARRDLSHSDPKLTLAWPAGMASQAGGADVAALDGALAGVAAWVEGRV